VQHQLPPKEWFGADAGQLDMEWTNTPAGTRILLEDENQMTFGCQAADCRVALLFPARLAHGRLGISDVDGSFPLIAAGGRKPHAAVWPSTKNP